jgi:hypothetical protein
MSLITDEHDLAAALAHHRAGRRLPAETIYRQILARDPQQPDALHLLSPCADAGPRPLIRGTLLLIE